MAERRAQSEGYGRGLVFSPGEAQLLFWSLVGLGFGLIALLKDRQAPPPDRSPALLAAAPAAPAPVPTALPAAEVKVAIDDSGPAARGGKDNVYEVPLE